MIEYLINLGRVGSTLLLAAGSMLAAVLLVIITAKGLNFIGFSVEAGSTAAILAPVSLAVVDWQFLTCGRGASDVGSFLGGNVSIEDRSANELDLLRTYHTLLVENGVTGYPFSERCIFP